MKHPVGRQKKEYLLSVQDTALKGSTVSIKEHFREMRCYGFYFSLTVVFCMITMSPRLVLISVKQGWPQ